MPALPTLPVLPVISVTSLILVLLKVLLTGIVFLISSIVCAFLVILIHRALRVKRDREHVIKLINRGNFPSIFLLSVTSTENFLRFGLTLDGVPLVPFKQPVEPEQEMVPQAAAQPGPNQPQKSTPGGQAGQAAAPANTDQKKPSVNADAAMKGGQAAAGKVGAAAGFLGTLGELLPGSLGAGLKNQSASLRESQGSALQAMQAPKDAKANVDVLKQQTGQMVKAKPPAMGQPAPEGQSPQIQTAGTASTGPAAAASSHMAVVHSRPVASKLVSTADYTVQTQPLEPGAGYSLVLKIGSKLRRYPEGSFGYTFTSLQKPVDNLVGEPVPLMKHGVVNFPHVDAWRYWLAPVLNILIFTILLFACFYMFQRIWL